MLSVDFTKRRPSMLMSLTGVGTPAVDQGHAVSLFSYTDNFYCPFLFVSPLEPPDFGLSIPGDQHRAC